MTRNLAHMLVRSARAFPERAALYVGKDRLATFPQLAERVARGARGLRHRLGLAPGERVALVLKNCPQYVELLYAIWHAGLCAVPINAKLHPKEIAYILEDSGARLCFLGAELEDMAEAAATGSFAAHCINVPSAAYRALFEGPGMAVSEVGDEALAWLFYTSGTTGRPKGVMLSHRNLTAMAWCFAGSVDSIAPGDCLLHAAPMSHGSGLYIIPYLAEGASQVIPPSGGFDTGELCRLIAAHPRASLFAAPTMVNRLLEHLRRGGADIGNLKTLICGGAPMYLADSRAALACFGARVAQIYGQGESPMTITAQPASRIAMAHATDDWRYLASVGQPCPGIEVRIADADDRPLGVGDIGEILVRGPTVMQGYWNNPVATAATLRGGWLHTGDVGCLDERGLLTLKDRSKDVIISGGSNIYPREVEDALLGHAAVAEVSVLGRPHADWGEEVVAIVVVQPERSVDEAALDAWCLEHIARFKRPKSYLFVDRLPKNSTGKVLKTVLRGLLAAQDEAPPAVFSGETTWTASTN